MVVMFLKTLYVSFPEPDKKMWKLKFRNFVSNSQNFGEDVGETHFTPD